MLAQCAIDSAKRVFEVDITDEINRLKEDLNVKGNGYPPFWLVIRPGFDRKKINPQLHSPMGYLYKLKSKRAKYDTPTLPLSEFFVRHKMVDSHYMSKKVEELINKYSLELTRFHMGEEPTEDYYLLREDFEQLIEDICMMKLSKKYVGLFSWLIDRAFLVSPAVKSNEYTIQNRISKNKTMLIKVLYQVNPKAFLMCFNRDLVS